MDAIFSFCMNMTAWQWMSLGLAFLAFELMFPGLFMLWFGLSGLLTAILVYLLGFSGTASIVIFLIFSIAISVFSYKYFNRKAKFYVENVGKMVIGKVIVLEEPIVKGQAHAKIFDAQWTITGPDCPAGSKVKVVEVSSHHLVVDVVQ